MIYTNFDIDELRRKFKCCGKPSFEEELPETVVEGRFIIVDGQLYVGHEGVWLALGGSDIGTGTENNLTLWGASNTLTEDTNLSWNPTDNILSVGGPFIGATFSNPIIYSNGLHLGDVDTNYVASITPGDRSGLSIRNWNPTNVARTGLSITGTISDPAPSNTYTPFSIVVSSANPIQSVLKNTNGAGVVRSIIEANSNDASLVLRTNLLAPWTIGVDASDSNKFKIGSTLAVGSNSFGITITRVGYLVGINNSNPQTMLDIVGDLTVTSRTGTATSLSGFNASNKLVDLTLGSGLTIDSGVLNVSASSTGLEAIDEGNGVGWRFIGQNPAHFGNIGLNAVDLSIGVTNSSTYGATGAYSVAIVRQSTASGERSIAIGLGSIASNTDAIAIGSAQATGGACVAINNSVASGGISTAIGWGSNSVSYASLVVGSWGTIATGQSTSSWVSTDELFKIGNGIPFGTRSDALTIYKNAVQKIGGISGTALEAITAQDGMLAYVNATSGVFTSIGFWARENGVWNKL